MRSDIETAISSFAVARSTRDILQAVRHDQEKLLWEGSHPPDDSP